MTNTATTAMSYLLGDCLTVDTLRSESVARLAVLRSDAGDFGDSKMVATIDRVLALKAR